MKSNRPIGITLIGGFMIFGATVMLFTLNIDQIPPINLRFGVEFIPDIAVRLIIIVLSVIISGGFLKQLKWGYWSMLIYSIVFCTISLMQLRSYQVQPFIGNLIFSAFVAIYTLFHRNYFFDK